MICTSETIIKGNDCRNLYVFVLHDIQNLQHLTFCAPQYFRILFAIPFVVRVCWLLLRWLCLQSVFCTRRLFVSVGLTANAKELRETARLTEDDNEDDDEDHVADGVNGICSSWDADYMWNWNVNESWEWICIFDLFISRLNEWIVEKGWTKTCWINQKENDIFVQKSYWNWFYFIFSV